MPELAIRVRLGEADLAALNLAAAERKATISDVVRDALRMYLGQDSAVRVMPLIDAVVAKHADRLAALMCKVFTVSGMAAWEGRALVARLTDLDVDAVWRDARARALVDLRQPGTDRWGEEDLYPPETQPGPAPGDGR